MGKGALQGIRVLDLSRYIAGPYCGLLLADMGAEVIKIEKAGVGDETRYLAPWKNGVSLYYPAYNRNKKSVTVNFRDPEGIELIKKLVKTADVVLENFRAGTMEKMGLGYETLREINPRIVMASVTGFSQKGPYSNKVAFDTIISAISGVANITPHGVVTSRGFVNDIMGAMYAAYGIAMALYEREHTGEGQYVDVSMYGSSTVLRSVAMADYAMNGDKADENLIDCAPYGYTQTKDGWLAFHAGTDPIFPRLLKVIDDPVLHDPKYKDVTLRVKERDILMDAVARWAADKTNAQIEEIFEEAQIPAGAVATAETLLQSPHLQQTGRIVKVPVDGVGEVPFSGFPFDMSAHPELEYRHAPKLGENNSEIFGELGLTEEQLQQLKDRKVI